jgi:hypothetical protein
VAPEALWMITDGREEATDVEGDDQNENAQII